MDQGMNNTTTINVNLQLQPGASSSSSSAGGPQNPNPFALMSPTYLPRAPTSFQVWERPYFMNQVGGTSGAAAAAAAGSGSGTNNIGGIFQFKASASNYNHPFAMNVSTNSNLLPYNPNLYPLTSSHPTLPKIPIPALRKPVKIDGSDLRLGIGSRKPLDHNMDPKKLKRVISNRLSAQRSRVKKLDQISEMERKAEDYKNQVAYLRPQVAFLTNQKAYLQMEKNDLHNQIAACTHRTALAEAEIEVNRQEVIRLRQVEREKNGNQAGTGKESIFFIDGDDDPFVHAAVGDNIAEYNLMNNEITFKKREKAGQFPVFGGGWVPVDLNQSRPGHGQVPNPILTRPRHRRNVSVMPDFGGIEHFMNIDSGNPNPRN